MCALLEAVWEAVCRPAAELEALDEDGLHQERPAAPARQLQAFPLDEFHNLDKLDKKLALQSVNLRQSPFVVQRNYRHPKIVQGLL